jgi:hypothetical protein
MRWYSPNRCRMTAQGLWNEHAVIDSGMTKSAFTTLRCRLPYAYRITMSPLAPAPPAAPAPPPLPPAP